MCSDWGAQEVLVGIDARRPILRFVYSFVKVLSVFYEAVGGSGVYLHFKPPYYFTIVTGPHA